MEKRNFPFFSVIIIFLKNAYLFNILTSVLRLFRSFIQHGKNNFLKAFDLEGVGFILVVDADLKG